MKYSLALLTILFFSFGSAQSIPQVNDYRILGSNQEFSLLIQEAESEVLIATETLKSKDIAETLHALITERGLEVFILSPIENIEQRANYVQSLALAGAIIHFGSVGSDFIIIDRKHVIAHSEADAYYFDSETHGRYFASVFRQAFVQGEIYDPFSNFEGSEE